MKLKSYNILFRIFSFLSDKTNGAPFFVKYKLLLGTLLIGMATSSAEAQQKVNKRNTISSQQVSNRYIIDEIEISGNVKDERGEEIIGVSVFIPGTSIGTITDIDGNFSLKVRTNDKLVISYLDYETQEIRVSDIKGGKVNVVLKEESRITN